MYVCIMHIIFVIHIVLINVHSTCTLGAYVRRLIKTCTCLFVFIAIFSYLCFDSYPHYMYIHIVYSYVCT